MTIYKPYTYLIHHIPTNTFYYGVRWENVRLKRTPEEDFWIYYFTRSKKVKQLIAEYGKESFEFEIRKKFNSIEQAKNWETKVLTRMKVLDKPDIWLNRTNNVAIFNEVHPRGTLGKKLPFNKGASENNKLIKIGNQYTKGTKWIHNEHEKRMIPKDSPIPEGFQLGTGRTNKRPDLSEYNRKHNKLKFEGKPGRPMKGELNPMFGKKHSDQTKNKISLSQKIRHTKT
jgi:hypothetical protein